MYFCKRCKAEFDYPNNNPEEHCGLNHYTCPECGSESVLEKNPCIICGEHTDNIEICDECENMLTQNIRDFVQEMSTDCKIPYSKMEDLINEAWERI